MPKGEGQQADQPEDGHHEEADQADEAQETDDAREAQGGIGSRPLPAILPGSTRGQRFEPTICSEASES